MDDLGFSFFSANRTVFVGIASFLSFFAFLCFLVATIGYSTSAGSIQSTCWATGYYSSNDYTSSSYIGLKGYYVVTTVNGYTETQTVDWSDSDSCVGSYCSTCNSAGSASFALVLLSLLFTVAILVATIMRAVAESSVAKIASVTLSGIVAIFSLSSFASWKTGCFDPINSDAVSGETVSLFNGFDLTVVGFVTIFIVYLLNLLLPVNKKPEGLLGGNSKV